VRKHYDAGNMQALQEKWRGQDVIWLTVNSSAPGQQGYFETADLPARLEKERWAADAYLLDTDGKVGRAYGATATPHMFVIDPEGTVVYAGAPAST
jgi:hypothetical protein